jgi:plastocyanin
MLYLAVGAAVAIAAPAASAAPTQIEFGSNFFDSDDVTVDFVPGENTFEWNRNDLSKNYHSITSVDGYFGIGPGGFSDFDLRASAGTFKYYCTNHGANGTGMVGTVAVRPIAESVTADSFDVIWADNDSTTGFERTIRWKVKGKDGWNTWFTRTDANDKLFGKKDRPVDVKPGKAYLLQVRADGVDPSAWSPKLEVIAP